MQVKTFRLNHVRTHLYSMNSSTFTSPALTFQGPLTTALAERRLLRGDELAYGLKQEKDPYLGRLPDSFINALDGMQESEILAHLDSMIGKLRANPHCLETINAQPNKTFEYNFGNPGNPLQSFSMKGRFLGKGYFGYVYQLQVGEVSFALKIFKPKTLANKLGKNGPWAESSAGLYLSALRPSDLAPFYVSHPEKGWQLSVFIPPEGRAGLGKGDIPNEEDSQTLSALGFTFEDDDIPENRVHGYRVDYGSLSCFPQTRWVMRLETFVSWAMRTFWFGKPR
ncbi:MAG: hypothetical protein K2X66_08400 [Cyanobacteria bacterium]|nr:hypothetical protein [Cyanobacteriota bacterium]